MGLFGYSFIGEVEDFNLDEYTLYEGWVNDDRSRLRFYTKNGQNSFFVHDTEISKLYEFIFETDTNVKEMYLFQNAANAYKLQYPRNFDQ